MTLSQDVHVPPASPETAHVLGAYTQGMTFTVSWQASLGTLLTFKVAF
ncbi:MAG: hypothetical protein ACE5OW_04450 [Candidatus Bathyarchaeia archaeon]